MAEKPGIPRGPDGTHGARVDARYNLTSWQVIEAAR